MMPCAITAQEEGAFFPYLWTALAMISRAMGTSTESFSLFPPWVIYLYPTALIAGALSVSINKPLSPFIPALPSGSIWLIHVTEPRFPLQLPKSQLLFHSLGKRGRRGTSPFSYSQRNPWNFTNRGLHLASVFGESLIKSPTVRLRRGRRPRSRQG